MVTPILIDILIVAALLFFAWRGAKKGFVLTLCSLVAVFVALIGASILSNAAAPYAAGLIRPRLETAIQETLEEKAQDMQLQDRFPVEEVSKALREKGGIYVWAADELDGLFDLDLSQPLSQQAASLAALLSSQLAHGILFFLIFILVLIAWFIFSHALDLVAKLPVLSTLNEALGGILGLVKGLVFVYICAWFFCSLISAVPSQMAEESYLLRLLTRLSPLELLKL